MIPLYKVYMPKDVELGINEILYSGKLTFGSHGEQFENSLRAFLGNSKVLVTNSNNVAIQIAFDILDLHCGDEVIASPMSCLASNQPILTNRLKIVWADVDPATGTLDPEDVIKRITPNTKAIMHYHWCGNPGYIDEINQIARNHGLYVVEDGTESFGAEYRGKKIGNTGSDIVCFSFQPVRLPTSIEGGAIAVNSEDLFQKAAIARDYGIDRSSFRDSLGEISSTCDIPRRGYQAMMPEMNGFIGQKCMESVPELLHRQQINVNTFNALLDKVGVSKLNDRTDAKSSGWVYSLADARSGGLLEKLRAQQVYSSRVHLRNDHYSCFGSSLRRDLLGVNAFSEREISIPSGWWLTDADRVHICDVLTDFFLRSRHAL